jgi:hypothetical protein
MISLEIKSITVIVDNCGPDTLYFNSTRLRIHAEELEIPSPFPALGYAPCLKMEAAQGYGVEWCRKTFGIEPTVIRMQNPSGPEECRPVQRSKCVMCESTPGLCPEHDREDCDSLLFL